MNYTAAQMQQARQTDLYDFLLRHHSNTVKREGDSLRPVSNKSISIKRGYCGYRDFSNDETGNSVDYLVRHLNYSTVEAVIALCDMSPCINVNDDPVINVRNSVIELPSPVNGAYRQLFAYLTRRGIPADVIQMLIDENLIYQESAHNNIVFVNKERDFAELRGTLSNKPFHGCRKSSPDRFWWFRTDESATTAYICESAIDAISLYILIKEPAYYISLAGVANQQTIDRIRRQPFLKKIILAVDNDDAGNACRERNKDLRMIIPKHKDWNEDLIG